MAPDAYLVAVWDPRNRLPDTLNVPDILQRAYQGPGISVWVSPNGGLPVHPIDPSTVVLGDVFVAPDGSGERCADYDVTCLAGSGFETTSVRLIGEAWGRYVLIGRERARAAALRDPGGALDCATWRVASVRYFASRMGADLDPLLPPELAIDWRVVLEQLHEPLAVNGASALCGVEAMAPGAIWVEEDGKPPASRQIWRPTEIAKRSLVGVSDPAAQLRACVRTCVSTLVGSKARILGEISGGLDSAIVATCLAHSAQPSRQRRVVNWINFATDEIEGDERTYARAIAAGLEGPLDERRKGPLRYDEAALAHVGADFRVGLTALDPDYDADLAAQARTVDAEALVTGQGGDAVFLQMAIDDMLVDQLRAQKRLDLGELLAHSRRRRQSVWRTLRITLRRAVWPEPWRRPARSYLRERAPQTSLAHPWLVGAQSLPPAKAAQLWSLAVSQNVFGPSRRSEVVKVLHPLLSQPLLELTLRLPSYVLSRPGEDRALARQAFAAELPGILLRRRSKGALQAFYGRAVAGSLDALRPWLLDGALAQRGLIKRAQLAPLLDPDILIVRAIYVELLHAAAIEAWVRAWMARIERLKAARPCRQA